MPLHSPTVRRLLLVGLLFLCLASTRPAAAQISTADPPCNGWTLHTRTDLAICPEVVIEGFPAQGLAAIGAITFDTEGVLYVSRPASGDVLRLRPDPQRRAQFLPPETVAAGLVVPQGLACADTICYVATGTQVIRLSDQQALLSDLSPYAAHPLHLDATGRLWVGDDHRLRTVATDGSNPHSTITTDNPVADFGWTAQGTLWASDGDSELHRITPGTGSPAVIALPPDSSPTGVAFYPDQTDLAFPQWAAGLLVVTSGSWNTPLLTGYELWRVPFAADQPQSAQTIIPANYPDSDAVASVQLTSFFPDHPVALAVSPEGWVYIAVREGRIVRLRPRVTA